MKTIKRSIPDVDTSLKNTSKYFNQMTWKGLMHNQNVFAVDQLSLQEAKNVYVDTEGSLISRYPLQKDTTLPSGVLPVGYCLVEILPIAEEAVYVSQSSDSTYSVTVDGTPVTTITGFKSYHLSTIEHYVVCFNEVNAKVFDVNIPEKGWQNLTDLAEIPITKRIVGGQETEYPTNGFTNSYKEQYIWSNESQPQLPTTEFNKPVRLTPDYVDFTRTASYPAYNNCEVVRNSNEVITALMINGVRYSRLRQTTQIEGEYTNAANNISYHLMADGQYLIKGQYGDWTAGTYTVTPGEWSSESGPIGDIPTGTVELNTGKQKIDWTIPQTGVLTDYRILRPLNIKVEDKDLFSVAMGIICIGREDHFLISYDEGNTFDRVWYPEHGLFLQVASISQDGQYFFFVAEEAVYRCNLADKSWVKILPYVLSGSTTMTLGTNPGVNNCSYFLTGDTFCFILYNRTTKELDFWVKGPGIGGGFYNNVLVVATIPRNNQTDYMVDFTGTRDMADLDCDRARLKISMNANGSRADMVGVFPSITSGKQVVVTVTGNQTGGGSVATEGPNYFYDLIDGKYAASQSAYPLTERFSTGRSATGIGTLGIVYLSSRDVTGAGWYNYRSEQGLERQTDGSYVSFQDFEILSKLVITSSEGYPYELTGGWIDNLTVFNKEGNISANLPTEITERKITWVMGDYFYMRVGDKVYTNRLSANDFATITYTYLSEDNLYTKVPTVSYSDTELYLGFGTLIQITANITNGTDISFNLPPINDHSFIAPITGMLNISTTEVAIFFLHSIVICAKVEDELLGYRYDYYNTKLSTGIRLGDSAINTLEGSYTVFPTRRGLAFMNYQAFMATTDQVIEYITDHIKEIWTNFYDASSAIKIMQWRSKLVLTNGTTNLLIFDLDESSWWQWQVPLNITMMLTDQIDLKLISDTLYIFKESNVYMDFPKTPQAVMIDWKVQSQPLHMNAPNYYKNMKQLVFQLLEGAESDTQHTLMAQVKLYRKRVTVRDPEVVAFKIEELRTFVKRFNYWKINEVQWGLGADLETATPAQLRLNGISVKYELGEEVR